ncbi:hypothetical protein LUZ63_001935 [Rhynchospora breviuscula]|uniref:EF-hand domain-containing protein n=1 Tax=Rhynchospora breviuscula TaxID=2022672 RepID=A0A9Q0CXY5_9POAL|nr:hypothetical protein LUZ63_001935 [Rhynchospora breviuscula]
MEEENVTEYEKQRLLRIRENKARLEALGLPGLASSISNDLSNQAQAKSVTTELDKKKRKKKSKDYDDEEYEPSDEDEDCDEEEEEEDVEKSQSSEEEMPSSSSSKRKGKRSSSSNKPKLSKNSRLNRGEKDGDFMDDDAIALSLGDSVANKNGACVQNKTSKTNSTAKKESFRNKNKSRIQLSEDEVIAYFFSFDEVGKGYVTEYDVEKMAIAHDFTWTDGEIDKMVRSFDSDGDRKLSLEDFRSIVSRCHMLQEPE